jgi:predicted aconitase with swiveling domain
MRGERLELTEPLSFWGGFDPQSGTITDPAHPQCGENVTGRILVLHRSRGSTNSPGALLESLRLGTGPSGFVLREPDTVVLVATQLAAVLYGIEVPVTILDRADPDPTQSGR